MMPKEFEQEYIKAENLSKAMKLAYDMGYEDGCEEPISNPDYEAQITALIDSLVGRDSKGHWPKEVNEAYNNGVKQGQWES